MRTYSHYEASNVPVQFVLSIDQKSRCNVKEGRLSEIELISYAHHCANMYKGLIVVEIKMKARKFNNGGSEGMQRCESMQRENEHSGA